MLRYIFLTLLFKSILFGCTVCPTYSPKAHVSLNIEADKEFIKHGKIKWTFEKEFTTELLNLYDLNLDGTLGKEEVQLIDNAILTYIEAKNYLTFISYDTKINEESRIIDVKKYKLDFINGILVLEYEFDLNYKIIDKNKLYIEVYDDGGFFIMLTNKKKQLFNIPYKIKKEMDYNSVTFTINSGDNNSNEVIEEDIVLVEEKNETLIEKSFQIEEEQDVEKKEKTLLEGFVKKIKVYLVEIEKGEDNLALFFLLLASFVYGVIHAIGPGHGKALAFSYFSAQKSTYTQAFVISLATAFIHIVGALILVLISILILQTVFNSFLDDSITYITQTSAVLIMLLSIFILYRKIKKKSCVCCACKSTNPNQAMFSTQGKNINFVQPSNNKIHFTSDRKKQDLFFVLTAGLIPCPGTVVLFVYAFILKTYVSVILASLFISLGMGLVIFLSSFLGVSLNKISAKKHKIINLVEIIAPIFMFILGLMLLLNANIF